METANTLLQDWRDINKIRGDKASRPQHTHAITSSQDSTLPGAMGRLGLSGTQESPPPLDPYGRPQPPPGPEPAKYPDPRYQQQQQQQQPPSPYAQQPPPGARPPAGGRVPVPPTYPQEPPPQMRPPPGPYDQPGRDSYPVGYPVMERLFGSYNLLIGILFSHRVLEYRRHLNHQ